MNAEEHDLKTLIKQADAGSPARRAAPLDAGDLIQRASGRGRKRRACGAATCGIALIFCALFVQPSDTPPLAAAPDLETLTAEIDSLVAQTNELVERIDAQQRALVAAPADIRLLAVMRFQEIEEMKRLKAQLAELESRAAVDDQLAWEIEWSRSGALRLELAHQDARRDPQVAAKHYKQIAAAYAGTRWGEEAKLALVEYGTP